MKAVVCQVPRELTVTSVLHPGPGPGEARPHTSGHCRTRGVVTHVPQHDDRTRVPSLPRNGLACQKAVLAP